MQSSGSHHLQQTSKTTHDLHGLYAFAQCNLGEHVLTGCDVNGAEGDATGDGFELFWGDVCPHAGLGMRYSLVLLLADLPALHSRFGHMPPALPGFTSSFSISSGALACLGLFG